MSYKDLRKELKDTARSRPVDSYIVFLLLSIVELDKYDDEDFDKLCDIIKETLFSSDYFSVNDIVECLIWNNLFDKVIKEIVSIDELIEKVENYIDSRERY